MTGVFSAVPGRQPQCRDDRSPQPDPVGHLRVVDDFNLTPVLSQLTVPLLVLHGEDDRVAAWGQAERTAAATANSPRVNLIRNTAALGGSGHCSMDSMESGVDILYDQFAEMLSDIPASDAR
jgi:pimeloyl-ACP methyl ester carboxylesterase